VVSRRRPVWSSVVGGLARAGEERGCSHLVSPSQPQARLELPAHLLSTAAPRPHPTRPSPSSTRRPSPRSRPRRHPRRLVHPTRPPPLLQHGRHRRDRSVYAATLLRPPTSPSPRQADSGEPLLPPLPPWRVLTTRSTRPRSPTPLVRVRHAVHRPASAARTRSSQERDPLGAPRTSRTGDGATC